MVRRALCLLVGIVLIAVISTAVLLSTSSLAVSRPQPLHIPSSKPTIPPASAFKSQSHAVSPAASAAQDNAASRASISHAKTSHLPTQHSKDSPAGLSSHEPRTSDAAQVPAATAPASSVAQAHAENSDSGGYRLVQVHYPEAFPRLKWQLFERPPLSFSLAASELQPMFLFNVQPSHYFEWQSRFLSFAFRQSGQGGKTLRLLSSSSRDHLVSEVNTAVVGITPEVDEFDQYTPFNKPASIRDVLRALPDDDRSSPYLVLLDPDCIVTRPFIRVGSVRGESEPVALVQLHNGYAIVKRGQPLAQQSYVVFNADGLAESVAKHFCSSCAWVDPIAFPIIIHRDDLRKISDLWFSETKRMKRTQSSWEKRWSDSDFALQWTAEMFAYMFAAARMGVRHMITDFLQDQPAYHTTRVAPIIHYSLTFKLSNGVSWGKGMPDADGEPLNRLLKAPLSDQDEVIAAFVGHIRRYHSFMTAHPSDVEWGSNYYGAVHDVDAGVSEPGKVAFYWPGSAELGVVHYGNWSEQTEDVLDGKSCGHELQGNQNKQIRVKEAAQRLCEECQASCSGISSKDRGKTWTLAGGVPQRCSGSSCGAITYLLVRAAT